MQRSLSDIVSLPNGIKCVSCKWFYVMPSIHVTAAGSSLSHRPLPALKQQAPPVCSGGNLDVQGDLLDNVMGRISDHRVQKNAERHANKRRFTALGGAMRACESLAAQWEEPSCGAELITHWAEVRYWFHKIIVRYLLVRRCLFSSCVCLL